MKCAIGHCGHCQLGPALRLPGRAGLRCPTDRAAARRCGSCDGGDASPKLAVWKFASCDGCQLSLLDCEDELLALAGEVEIAYFLEATRGDRRGPLRPLAGRGLDHHAARRRADPGGPRQSRRLVTIGACATAGGIQALRNFADVEDFMSVVYATPEYISTLETSTPICDHVPRRLRAPGLPDQQAPAARGDQRLPQRAPARRSPSHSVCIECKRRGNVCVMVAHGTPCLGPVTHAGCGALCPAYDRGCYGCFGPMETPNTASLAGWLRGGLGIGRASTSIRVYRTFNAARRAVPRARASAHGGRWRNGATRTIRTEALARVEGEGAMYVRIRGGEVEDVELRIYEPPRFFEALPARPRVHRGARHHRADLRHLPGRLPDERLQRDGGRAAASTVDERDPRLCAGSSTAASGSRATRCTSSCSTRPTSSATRAPSAMARDHREVVERGLRMKKAGNELIAVDRRARDPPDQRPGRRLLPGADRSASSPPLAERSSEAREVALRDGRWAATLDFPDFEQDYEFVALRAPGRVPDRARPDRLRRAGSTSRPASTRSTSSRSTSRTRPRCTRGCADGGTYLVGPLARYASTSTGSRRWRARRPPRPGSATSCRNPFKSIVVRAVEILYACDEALRHHRRPTSRPTAPAVEVAPRAGDRATAWTRGAARDALPPLRARRRRARSSTARIVPPTSQNQARDRGGPARVRRARRRPRRRASCTLRCEQAIRNYDPCISCATHFLQLEVDRGVTPSSSASATRGAATTPPGWWSRRGCASSPRGGSGWSSTRASRST